MPRGDQFFLPDSSQFYFDDLKGEKYLRYVPNTEHSLAGRTRAQSMQAFYEAVISGEPAPEVLLEVREGRLHSVKSETKPTEVRLWQATNPKARDFRVDTIGKAYTSTVLKDQGGGVYVGKVAKPARAGPLILSR